MSNIVTRIVNQVRPLMKENDCLWDAMNISPELLKHSFTLEEKQAIIQFVDSIDEKVEFDKEAKTEELKFSQSMLTLVLWAIKGFRMADELCVLVKKYTEFQHINLGLELNEDLNWVLIAYGDHGNVRFIREIQRISTMELLKDMLWFIDETMND